MLLKYVGMYGVIGVLSYLVYFIVAFSVIAYCFVKYGEETVDKTTVFTDKHSVGVSDLIRVGGNAMALKYCAFIVFGYPVVVPMALEAFLSMPEECRKIKNGEPLN